MKIYTAHPLRIRIEIGLLFNPIKKVIIISELSDLLGGNFYSATHISIIYLLYGQYL